MNQRANLPFETLKARLQHEAHTWLITGGAGFIGSHLMEQLLRLNQRVVCLDNFWTGSVQTVEEVQRAVGRFKRKRLKFYMADIRDPASCRKACEGVDFVLHQAALASVPASIEDPMTFHEINVTGTLNLLHAARNAGVKRLVFASSCAVYGDESGAVKREALTGCPLSPYAASKAICESYAATFAQCYRLPTVGLRYFNVFGPRQNPGGAYAAVIPLWIEAMLAGEPVHINGDGKTTRDFVSVFDVVQANLLAAFMGDAQEVAGRSFNVGSGASIDLVRLAGMIRNAVVRTCPDLAPADPVHRDFRPGDIRHSCSDISLANQMLGFHPLQDLQEALDRTVSWYHERRKAEFFEEPITFLTDQMQSEASAA